MLVPDRFRRRESRDLEHVLVQRHPANAVEVVIIEERAARLHQAAYAIVAGRDRRHLLEIVDRDGRDREIEWPADGLRPGRIAQIAERIADPIAEPLARAIEHRLRIVLQGDRRAWERLQHRVGDEPSARPDVDHPDRSVTSERNGGDQPLDDRLTLALPVRVAGYPVVDVAGRMPIMMVVITMM